jgi:hypothetical protein
MNYCSIEDAWKNSDYITDQYKKYDSQDDIVEKFDQLKNYNEINYTINDNYIPQQNIKKVNIENKKFVQKCVFTCDNFISHLNKCPSCRMKIKKQFSSKIMGKLQHIIFDNKDTVLLILMTLFILIFFNLLFSIIRN